ncbi:MAG: tripartite tricarboxylate transporter TctB family protein [Deltaproteobacteria bacterium]|nr:tripartite tricarboxylate transporter TctB family protein [Deltaproteobacteria bacterium]
MKNRDVVSSIVWMALGCLFVGGALHQGLMRKGVPGPGFLPFLSGMALIFIALFVLIPALVQKEKENGSDFFPESGSFRKLVFALVALLAFGVALNYLGYLITTFLFMFLMARLIEPKGWWITALVALLTAVVSYLLFVVLLEVQLPTGPLGF